MAFGCISTSSTWREHKRRCANTRPKSGSYTCMPQIQSRRVRKLPSQRLYPGIGRSPGQFQPAREGQWDNFWAG
eukprot:11765-Rhodomonas_salina.1